MLDNTEDSPKRRSTFYVSLDGEPRHNTSKLVKTLSSADSEKFSCNTFPISTSKTSPSAVLTRTLSNNDAFVGQQRQHKNQRSVSIDNSGVSCEATLPEPRGKVQSLTRIFEGPIRSCVESGADGSPNDSGQQQQQQTRKKVERTRSFKTIERFQSRFTGRKEVSRNKEQTGVRLNQTIAGPESGINNNEEVKEDVVKEEQRKQFREAEDRRVEVRSQGKFVKAFTESGSRNTETLVQQQQQQQNNKQSENPRRPNGKQNNNGNAGGGSGPGCSGSGGGSAGSSTTFTNLLIRRTHSTKVARSASTLGRTGTAVVGNRHVLTSSTSVDASTNSRNVTVSSGNSVDCCNDRDYTCCEKSGGGQETCGGQQQDCAGIDSSAFEDPDGDAAVHSGRFFPLRDGVCFVLR